MHSEVGAIYFSVNLQVTNENIFQGTHILKHQIINSDYFISKACWTLRMHAFKSYNADKLSTKSTFCERTRHTHCSCGTIPELSDAGVAGVMGVIGVIGEGYRGVVPGRGAVVRVCEWKSWGV